MSDIGSQYISPSQLLSFSMDDSRHQAFLGACAVHIKAVIDDNRRDIIRTIQVPVSYRWDGPEAGNAACMVILPQGVAVEPDKTKAAAMSRRTKGLDRTEPAFADGDSERLCIPKALSLVCPQLKQFPPIKLEDLQKESFTQEQNQGLSLLSISAVFLFTERTPCNYQGVGCKDYLSILEQIRKNRAKEQRTLATTPMHIFHCCEHPGNQAKFILFNLTRPPISGLLQQLQSLEIDILKNPQQKPTKKYECIHNATVRILQIVEEKARNIQSQSLSEYQNEFSRELKSVYGPLLSSIDQFQEREAAKVACPTERQESFKDLLAETPTELEQPHRPPEANIPKPKSSPQPRPSSR